MCNLSGGSTPENEKKTAVKLEPLVCTMYQGSQLMPIVLANITIIICSGNAGKVLSYVAVRNLPTSRKNQELHDFPSKTL